jgi:Fe-S oxidoreductase
VPEILRTLVAGGRARSPKLAAAAACTGCGACDLACPQAISPARIVGDLGVRLRAGGVAPPRRGPRGAPRLPEELALARLGLLRYARSRPATLGVLDGEVIRS